MQNPAGVDSGNSDPVQPLERTQSVTTEIFASIETYVTEAKKFISFVQTCLSLKRFKFF